MYTRSSLFLRIRSLLKTVFWISCCLLSCVTGMGQTVFFIENKGQWDPEARYRAETQGAAVFLTPKGFVYNNVSVQDLENIHHLTDKGVDVSSEKVRQHAYSVYFKNRNIHSYFTHISGAYYENYIRGNEPAKWVGHAAACEAVRQHDLYRGIDLNIYSKKGNIKYDFEISPEGDPANIVLDYSGVMPRLSPDGHLLIRTSVNEVREEAPYAYQVIGGKEQKVPCFYVLKGQQVRFSLPEGYDKRYPLVIDPALIFSTYSGAQSSSFYSFTTTYDKHGNLYSGGQGWGI